MTSLGDAIVTLKMDNSDLEGKAAMAAQTLDNLGKTGANVGTGMSSGLKEAGSNTDQMAARFGAAGGVLDEMESKSKRVFTGLAGVAGVAGLTAGFGAFVAMAKNATEQFQNFGVQYHATFGSSGDAMLGQVSKFSNQMGVPFGNAASAMGEFGIATHGHAQNFMGDMKTFQDVAAGTGNSIDSITNSISNYYEMIQRMGGAGGGASYAARSLLTQHIIDPETYNQLRIQANQGASTQTLLNSILADAQKQYGGAGQQEAGTLSGKLNTFKNELQDFMRVSGQGFLGNFATDLDKLGAQLSSPAFEKGAKSIGDFIGEFVKGGMYVVGFVGDIAKIGAEAVSIADKFKPFKDLLEVLGGLLAAKLVWNLGESILSMLPKMVMGMGSLTSANKLQDDANVKTASSTQMVTTATEGQTVAVNALTQAIVNLQGRQLGINQTQQAGLGMGPTLPGLGTAAAATAPLAITTPIAMTQGVQGVIAGQASVAAANTAAQVSMTQATSGPSAEMQNAVLMSEANVSGSIGQAAKDASRAADTAANKINQIPAQPRLPGLEGAGVLPAETAGLSKTPLFWMGGAGTGVTTPAPPPVSTEHVVSQGLQETTQAVKQQTTVLQQQKQLATMPEGAPFYVGGGPPSPETITPTYAGPLPGTGDVSKLRTWGGFGAVAPAFEDMSPLMGRLTTIGAGPVGMLGGMAATVGGGQIGGQVGGAVSGAGMGLMAGAMLAPQLGPFAPAALIAGPALGAGIGLLISHLNEASQALAAMQKAAQTAAQTFEQKNPLGTTAETIQAQQPKYQANLEESTGAIRKWVSDLGHTGTLRQAVMEHPTAQMQQALAQANATGQAAPDLGTMADKVVSQFQTAMGSGPKAVEKFMAQYGSDLPTQLRTEFHGAMQASGTALGAESNMKQNLLYLQAAGHMTEPQAAALGAQQNIDFTQPLKSNAYNLAQALGLVADTAESLANKLNAVSQEMSGQTGIGSFNLQSLLTEHHTSYQALLQTSQSLTQPNATPLNPAMFNVGTNAQGEAQVQLFGGQRFTGVTGGETGMPQVGTATVAPGQAATIPNAAAMFNLTTAQIGGMLNAAGGNASALLGPLATGGTMTPVATQAAAQELSASQQGWDATFQQTQAQWSLVDAGHSVTQAQWGEVDAGHALTQAGWGVVSAQQGVAQAGWAVQSAAFGLVQAQQQQVTAMATGQAAAAEFSSTMQTGFQPLAPNMAAIMAQLRGMPQLIAQLQANGQVSPDQIAQLNQLNSTYTQQATQVQTLVSQLQPLYNAYQAQSLAAQQATDSLNAATAAQKQYQDLMQQPLVGTKAQQQLEASINAQMASVTNQMDILKAAHVYSNDPRMVAAQQAMNMLQTQLSMVQSQGAMAGPGPTTVQGVQNVLGPQYWQTLGAAQGQGAVPVGAQGGIQYQQGQLQVAAAPSNETTFGTALQAAQSLSKVNDQIGGANGLQQQSDKANKSLATLNVTYDLANQKTQALYGQLQAEVGADSQAIGSAQNLVVATQGVTSAGWGLVNAQHALQGASWSLWDAQNSVQTATWNLTTAQHSYAGAVVQSTDAATGAALAMFNVLATASSNAQTWASTTAAALQAGDEAMTQAVGNYGAALGSVAQITSLEGQIIKNAAVQDYSGNAVANANLAISNMASGTWGPLSTKDLNTEIYNLQFEAALQQASNIKGSRETGGSIPETGAYNLHAGEYVLTSGQASAAQNLGQQMAASYGWTGDQWAALNNVALAESGWSMTAKNPTSSAYGIAQFISGPNEYYQYGGDPNTMGGQITGFLNYIRDRYGTPGAAWAHEQADHWYASGGMVDAPSGAPVNAVVHGGEFILNMQAVQALNSGLPVNVQGTTSNQQPQQLAAATQWMDVLKAAHVYANDPRLVAIENLITDLTTNQFSSATTGGGTPTTGGVQSALRKPQYASVDAGVGPGQSTTQLMAGTAGGKQFLEWMALKASIPAPMATSVAPTTAPSIATTTHNTHSVSIGAGAVQVGIDISGPVSGASDIANEVQTCVTEALTQLLDTRRSVGTGMNNG